MTQVSISDPSLTSAMSSWIEEFRADLETFRQFFAYPHKRNAHPLIEAYEITAEIICSWAKRKSVYEGERLGTLMGRVEKLRALLGHLEHIEGIEDPHTHPEPPSDKILTDFFVPNSTRGPRC